MMYARRINYIILSTDINPRDPGLSYLDYNYYGNYRLIRKQMRSPLFS